VASGDAAKRKALLSLGYRVLPITRDGMPAALDLPNG
jgi:hypothetical protein